MTLGVERTRERPGPPRLLFVATVAGTVSGFLSPFGDYFRSIGWRVDAAARGITSDPDCRGHFDDLWDMTWSRDPWDPANLKAAKSLQHIVHENGYDIVHVHTPIAGFVTRLALREARRRRATKIVYTAHGFHCHPAGRPLANLGFRSLERLAGSQTDILVVINHEDERLARYSGLAGRGRIIYMPGIGVDLNHYSRDRLEPDAVASVRSHLGLSSSDNLFLMVAGFQPGKRFEIRTSDNMYAAALQALELYPGALKGVSGRFFESDAFEVDVRASEAFDKGFPRRERKATDAQKEFQKIASMREPYRG